MPLVESGGAPSNTEAPAVDKATAKAHWAKTSSLMLLVLGIWFFFSFVVHIFAPSLNGIRILGFPFGFYMAAQGSLIVFVVALFWFGKRQNQIDEEFGVQRHKAFQQKLLLPWPKGPQPSLGQGHHIALCGQKNLPTAMV